MKFPTPPAGTTEAEIDAGIDEAWAEAIRNGLLVPTGETKWSERKQCMMPVYMRTSVRMENQMKDSFCNDVRQLAPAQQRDLNRPREPLPPTYYTAHGGHPTNAAEWADHNFGVGAFYASHGIGIWELETDWPEVFNNVECMHGFDPAAFPPPGEWPHESEWEVNELTGQPIPPWLKFDEAGRAIPPWRN